jgi:hypothetical protein
LKVDENWLVPGTLNRNLRMPVTDFKSSLAGMAPPAGLARSLTALWWAGKGDWNKGHQIVQDESGWDAAWVHAYLHRVEGDLGNAGYWYRRARKPVATNPLETEWEEIASALLLDRQDP